MPVKFLFTVVKHPIGITTGSSYIESYAAHALMKSQGHCAGKNGRRSAKTGDFYTYKRDVTHSTTQGRAVDFTWSTLASPTSTYRMIGCAGGSTRAPNNPWGNVPTFEVAAEGLAGQYAKGFAMARPGNPIANIGQFMAEMRDLPKAPFASYYGKAHRNRRFSPLAGHTLPQVVTGLRRRAEFFLNLGSEYLNYAFGWRPFVNDMRKTYNLTKEIDRRMAQLIRENNKRINRRVTVSRGSTMAAGPNSNSLKPVTEAVQAMLGDPNWSASYNFPFYNCLGGPGNANFVGRSVTMVTRTTEDSDRFAGTFQYYIPDTGSLQWQRQARLMLFGGLPTPQMVWNLTPWSWLTDWAVNMDSLMSNISMNAVGSTPTVWASGMTRVKRSQTVYQTYTNILPPTNPNHKWKELQFGVKTVDRLESKIRVGGGNPFGLNVTMPELSLGQSAILASLGMSRAKVK